MAFLRFLRVVTFFGATVAIGALVWRDVGLDTLLARAAALDGVRSYCTAVSLACLVAYPILVVLTCVVLKAKGYGSLFRRNGESLTVFALFRQNELVPLWQFLTDTLTRIPSPVFGHKLYRWPYSVDMAQGMTVWQYRAWLPVVFLYRTVRLLIIVALVATARCVSVNYIAATQGVPTLAMLPFAGLLGISSR